MSHLADDVQYFDCSLIKISAFPFENKLQTLKRYVRSAHNPIAQIYKRLQELDSIDYKDHILNAKLYISTRMEKDSEESRQFAMIQKHRRRDNKYDAHLLHVDNVDNFFQDPCPSKYLSICLVRDWRNHHITRTVIYKDQLHRKVVILPINDRDYLFITMLHEIEVDRHH